MQGGDDNRVGSIVPIFLSKGAQVKKILYQPWGGLGDNLAFSTLPEVYSNMGYTVYLHENNVFRNDGIKKLIECNPFIKGYSSETPNIGSCVSIPSGNVIENPNFIAKIEHFHLGRSINNYARIYYKPRLLPEFVGRTVVDQNSQSHKRYVYSDVEEEGAVYLNDETRPDSRITKDIFEYCDIIVSCQKFICSLSGGAILASAIKHQFDQDLDVEVRVTQDIFNYELSREVGLLQYYFDNVKHIIIPGEYR